MLQGIKWSLTHRALRVPGGAWFRPRGRAHDSARIGRKRAESVLVVRLDGIGDLTLTTPFLRELRRNLPAAWIALVVRPALANLVELCPYVDEVLGFEPAVSRYWSPFQATSRALRLARRHLWPRGYDLAIAPRWDVDSHFGAMVTFLSGARRRLGYSEKVTEEKSRLNAGLDHLLTHVNGSGALRHEVERNLDLIAFMGGTVEQDRLELWCGEADERCADAILGEHDVQGNELLIAVAPGAGHPKRRWPLANFAEFGAWVGKHCAGRLVLVGGQDDERLGKELQMRLGRRVINVVGRTSLRETGALLKRCQLYVGNDAGPMHLASAAGLPVVEISCHPLTGSAGHANSPVRFGPWRVPHAILRPAKGLDACSDACNSALAHCIRGVSVGQVQAAVTSLLPRPAQAGA